MYLWHFRPHDADWVMAGPYFSPQIVKRDLPFYYANGIAYGVPWYDENVEKVTSAFLSGLNLDMYLGLIFIVYTFDIVGLLSNK